MIEINDRPADHSFTMKYSQPDEYHFCLDSVLLPRLVADLTRDSLSSDAVVMDMAAGCGVLGCEFLFYRPDVWKLVYLEKQKIFESHIQHNLNILRETIKTNVRTEIKIKAVKDWHEAHAMAYDLILVNPPYFFEDEGSTPPLDIKANCHFFLDSNPEDFIRAIDFYLRPGGEAYVLVKKPERWMFSLPTLSVSQVAVIRGTPVIKFTRLKLANSEAEL